LTSLLNKSGKVASWYAQYMSKVASEKGKKKGSAIDAVLLTDDRENARKAKVEGVAVAAVADYVRSLSNTSLAEKLAAPAETTSDQHGDRKKLLFPEHLATSEIASSIRAGLLRQGVFHVSRNNFLEGTVICEGSEVLVQGLEAMNRAVDGDIVAVEVFSKERWSAPTEVILEDEGGEDAEDSLAKEEATIRQAPRAAGYQRPTGRVAGIVRRKWRQV